MLVRDLRHEDDQTRTATPNDYSGTFSRWHARTRAVVLGVTVLAGKCYQIIRLYTYRYFLFRGVYGVVPR